MKFFKSNEWQWRLLRTIVQGIIGFLIANIDLLFANLTLDANTKAIMAEIGNKNTDIKEN